MDVLLASCGEKDEPSGLLTSKADGRAVVEMDRSMLSQQGTMDEVAKSVTRLLGLAWRAPGTKLATRRARLRNKLIAHIDERS